MAATKKLQIFPKSKHRLYDAFANLAVILTEAAYSISSNPHSNFMIAHNFLLSYDSKGNMCIYMNFEFLPGKDLFFYITTLNDDTTLATRLGMISPSLGNNAIMELKYLILGQIANALWHLHHSLKLLHRDLKNENLFVSNNGVKLGDFGFTCSIDSDLQTDTLMGTPELLQPELIALNWYHSIRTSFETILGNCRFANTKDKFRQDYYEPLMQELEEIDSLVASISKINKKKRNYSGQRSFAPWLQSFMDINSLRPGTKSHLP